jgi:hypothetical protein
MLIKLLLYFVRAELQSTPCCVIPDILQNKAWTVPLETQWEPWNMPNTGTTPHLCKGGRSVGIEKEMRVILVMFLARYEACQWLSETFRICSEKIQLVSGFASCGCSVKSTTCQATKCGHVLFALKMSQPSCGDEVNDLDQVTATDSDVAAARDLDRAAVAVSDWATAIDSVAVKYHHSSLLKWSTKQAICVGEWRELKPRRPSQTTGPRFAFPTKPNGN